MRLSLIVLGLVAGIGAGEAQTARLQVKATLISFDCADNCWLKVTWKGEEKTFMCTARLCETWQEKGALPPRLAKKSATLTLGAAYAVDGNGDARDIVVAVTALKL